MHPLKLGCLCTWICGLSVQCMLLMLHPPSASCSDMSTDCHLQCLSQPYQLSHLHWAVFVQLVYFDKHFFHLWKHCWLQSICYANFKSMTYTVTGVSQSMPSCIFMRVATPPLTPKLTAAPSAPSPTVCSFSASMLWSWKAFLILANTPAEVAHWTFWRAKNMTLCFPVPETT